MNANSHERKSDRVVDKPVDKPTRLSALSESDLVAQNFRFQYGEENVGFFAKYIPQFSRSDSRPTTISWRMDILDDQQTITVKNYINSLDLGIGRQFVELAKLQIDNIYTQSRVMRFDSEVVVGVFVFFSESKIKDTRIDWFIEYCADAIMLRKRSEALNHISGISNSFPSPESKDIFRLIGNAITPAMRTAETLILRKNRRDLSSFETVYSSQNNSIDVPDGVPSAIARSIEDGRIQLNNDVLEVRASLPRESIQIHNIDFFKENEYGSYISFSILGQDPVNGFTIFCLYRRPYAISIVEQELFKTFCLVIEGLYRRAVYYEGSRLSENGEKLEKILKHSLLIADIMHDATEDLVFVRNSLGSKTTSDDKYKARVSEARQILSEIIDAARSFKDSISDGIPTFQAKYQKKKSTNIRKSIQEIIDKYEISGDYGNVHFINKIDHNLETHAVAYSLRRAVDNAIKNSVKHLQNVKHRRREIEFTANRVADELKLSIIDNGMGMNDEQKEKCKELLYSTTKGMGFGMTIIEAAALAHKGRVEIHSEFGKSCKIDIYIEYR